MEEGEKLAVAFITTPRFRERHADEVEDFVVTDLWHLCQLFKVYSTGGTFGKVKEIISNVKYGDERAKDVDESIPVQIESEDDLRKQWRIPIRKTLEEVEGGYPGMIRITNDMIIGAIDAVIHLMDWDDVVGKPDTMALRRQANVHGIPIACDAVTARAMISGWRARAARGVPYRDLCKTGKTEPPAGAMTSVERLANLKLGDRVMALIAHDGMKLEMCRFVTEHARQIVEYDAVLSTGTTGRWIRRTLESCDRSKEEVDKVICCLSGPMGGDVQIAWMVVQGICRKVIFFQDPMVSHAHATDILLFEQALLYQEVERALATNPATAVAVLEG